MIRRPVMNHEGRFNHEEHEGHEGAFFDLTKPLVSGQPSARELGN